MFDYRCLLYSLDASVTITQLKGGQYEKNCDIDGLVSYLQKHSIDAFIENDGCYHAKTYHITSKPYIYYIMGSHDLLSKSMIAIVGPRKPSEYAYRVIDILIQELREYDVVTISGMAEGVDEYVHRKSIEYGIPTVAILGAGLAHVLHSSRRSLLHHIVQSGGLVYSEFRLKQSPTHYTYPQRNRIVAGYAECVVLPEAAIGSGSLITSEFAQKMQKPLYAVPNSIFTPTSEGTNRLLMNHEAMALTNVATWIDGLGLKKKSFTKGSFEFDNYKLSIDLSEQETNIYAIISQYSQGIEVSSLLSVCQMNLSELQTVLSMLEIYGLIRQLRPGCYGV